MALPVHEQETNIIFMRNSDMAVIYTSDSTTMTKLDKLIDSYLDQTIDLTMYDIFQKKLSSRIEKYKIEISELEKKYESIEPLDVRVEKAKASIRKLLDINYNGVDEKNNRRIYWKNNSS